MYRGKALSIMVSKGTNNRDFILTTDGDDIVNALDGNDIIYGSAGNDIFNGGGSEYDQVNYSGALSDYQITLLKDGSYRVKKPNGGTDTLTNIAGLYFEGEGKWYDITSVAVSEDGSSVINGTDERDFLTGTDKSDEMNGGAGNDIFYESAGDDMINGGGSEYDQVNYYGALADYEVTKNEDGSYTVKKPDGGVDTLTNIAGLFFEGESKWYDITTVAVSANGKSVIHGTDGRDFLTGTDKSDEMNGGAGNDIFYESAGDDVINGGGSEYDQVNYYGALADYEVNVNEDGSYTVKKPNGGVDTLTNIADLYFEGEAKWYDIKHAANASGNTTDAVNDWAGVVSGKEIVIDALANDTDPEGHTQTIAGFSNPANGTVELVDGKFVYKSNPGFVGTDTFTYDIVDENGAQDWATVEICVDPKHEEPQLPKSALGDRVWFDINGNGVQDQGENGVSQVTVHLKDATGAIISTTQTDENGYYIFDELDAGTYSVQFEEPEGFEFTRCDSGSNDAADSDADTTTGMTDTVNLGPDEFNQTLDAGLVSANSAPIATDDLAETCATKTVTIDVLANDRDLDGDNATASLKTGAINGTVTQNADGTFSYTANEGFFGTDTFTYELTDEHGATAMATVEVDVHEPTQIKASIVGETSIMEGTSGTYKVSLDQAVSEDTWFTIQVQDGTAQRVDRDDADANNQYFAWGGYIDRYVKTPYLWFHSGSGGLKHYRFEGQVWDEGAYDIDWNRRKAVGPDSGFSEWDYTVLQDGVVQVGGELRVLVKAGETMSTTFDVKAFKEKIQIDTDGYGDKGAYESEETFNIEITNVDHDADCEEITVEGFEGKIIDKSEYEYVREMSSPIALDLNGDAKIGVTGETSSKDKDADAEIGRTVEFDLDADGEAESIEWFDGSGDGILVDMSKIGADGSIDGSALFGDEGGKHANGYEKLAKHDLDGDGQVSGEELASLGVWIDDGDAILEDGELMSAADAGITSVCEAAEAQVEPVVEEQPMMDDAVCA